MKDAWMGSLAAQDLYDPVEGGFQAGIRATPWFDEFTAKYGEPNLNDPNYDYRAAWASGARPTVRDPGDNLLHWPSQFKGENHPNRYVGGVDTKTGEKIGDLANAFDVPLEQTYDRRLDRTWPGQLAQDAIGAVLAPGRALQSTEPITTEQMIKPAADLAGLVTGGSYAAPAQKGASGAGIRAYHSSPHDFDKFDLAKIGTGEGAQVYGHGLYFAESPAVSGQGGQYWQQFKGRALGGDPVNHKAMEYLQSYGFDRQAAAEGIDKFLKHGINKDNARAVAEHTAARDLLASGGQVGPRTYEVNINADPAHMLDWDNALPMNSPARAKLLELGEKGMRHHAGGIDRQFAKDSILSAQNELLTGEGALRTMGKAIDQARPILKAEGDPYALFGSLGAMSSRELNKAGIPGIKYLDQGSRGMARQADELLKIYETPERVREVAQQAVARGEDADYWQSILRGLGDKSHNYVIFDPNIIRIDKKYAVPVTAGAAGGMGALAAQNQYEEVY